MIAAFIPPEWVSEQGPLAVFPSPVVGRRALAERPDDPDWDLVLPDDDEPYPEPGDFWIDDDDWEDAA